MLEQIDQLTQRNLKLSQLTQQMEALRTENNQMRTLLGQQAAHHGPRADR